MAWFSISEASENPAYQIRPYLSEDTHTPLCHVVMAGNGIPHVAMILSIHEAGDLRDVLIEAIQQMQDLDSHPALRERD